jgi:hypothetical protein
MNDILLFYYCLFISTGGWIISQYGIYSKKIIHNRSMNVAEKHDDDENLFSQDLELVKFIESWSAGELFVSKRFQSFGVLLAIGVCFVPIIENSWWTILLIFFIGGSLASLMMRMFRKYCQIISIILVLVFGVMLINRFIF